MRDFLLSIATCAGALPHAEGEAKSPASFRHQAVQACAGRKEPVELLESSDAVPYEQSLGLEFVCEGCWN
jgi:hypothetical protein